ncbi:MAG TPA: metallophosphoesterase, partial [Bacteroidales bacterium]|nr:metallophosphoesterase [Bacteroidales bacterium]
WAYDFKIWKHRVSLPNLPQSFNGFRIVQISDMHLGTMATENSLKEAVRMINELKPDVIFFTGDLVNYATSEAFRFQHVLADLEAKHGIYATLGNHDYGDYKKWDSAEEKQENMEDLYDFFRDLRWKLLNNENDVIEMNGEQIAVLGVENWSAYPRFPKRGDMKKALKDVGSVPVKLLLSHDPTHFSSEVVQSYPEIDIAFAGHTHGMQFGIEIPGVKWSPAKYMYKHWAGLYEDTRHGKPQYLYVNRGLGVIGYPGRIGIMPEITLMELTKA